MIKFTLIPITALVACAAISGCSSEKALSGEHAEVLTLSNKLADATSKLAQREAAFETIRVKNDLQSEEVRALTNRVVSLRNELGSAIESQRKLQEQLQRLSAVVEAGRAREKAAEEARLSAEQALASCRAHSGVLAGNLELVQTELKIAATRVNNLEAERATLLRQWNDTAQLRAQLKNIKRPAQGLSGAFFPSSRQKFAANPDGTISPATSGGAEN